MANHIQADERNQDTGPGYASMVYREAARR